MSNTISSTISSTINKTNKERIYQFKVDETKLNVDKVANISKMVNTRVSDIDKRFDEFKASVQVSLNGLNERLNACDNKCEELLNALNAIMDVIEDHKNKIELLGK